MNKLFNLCLVILFHSINPIVYSQTRFSDFIQKKDMYAEASKMQEKGKIVSAIDLFQQTLPYHTFQYGSSISLFENYLELGNTEKAAEYLKMAASFGYEFSESAIVDSTSRKVLSENFIMGSELYRNKLDSSLANRLARIHSLDQLYRIKINSENNKVIQDSLFKLQKKIDEQNLEEFYEIIKDLGQWPPNEKIYRNSRVRIETIVVHAIEKENLFFLDLALKAARNNFIDWFVPMVIETNLLWRFQYEGNDGNRKRDGFNKLRKIKFLTNGEIDLNDDNTYFEVYCLKKLLRDNIESNISLFLVSHLNSKLTLSSLSNLKNVLVSMGISDSRISITEDVRKYDNDELGDYYIGYIETQ